MPILEPEVRQGLTWHSAACPRNTLSACLPACQAPAPAPHRCGRASSGLPQVTCLHSSLLNACAYMACTPLVWLRQVTLGPGAYSIEETAYWSERVYRWGGGRMYVPPGSDLGWLIVLPS